MWILVGVLATAVALAVVFALTRGSSSDAVVWSELPPLPNTQALADYESRLYDFLERRDYDRPEWGRDKGEGFTRVRDTGPYIDGISYGTHEAVRIYYSPAVIDWLDAGRDGEIPNGAMIVKEMFRAPAARYEDMSEDELNAQVHLWAVMVKDDRGARDGWFWSYYDSKQVSPPTRQAIDRPGEPAFEQALYPASGFGQYCTRCHASADAEMTFSSLRNVEGEPGAPLRFRVDDSWRTGEPKALASLTGVHKRDTTTDPAAQLSPDEIAQAAAVLARFESAFPQQRAVAGEDVVALPNTSWDWVLPDPDGPTQFATSVQCMSCHDGQGLPFGPNMYIPPRASGVTSAADFETQAGKLDLTDDQRAALEEVHDVAQAWMEQVDSATKCADDEDQTAAETCKKQAADLEALALSSIERLATDTGLSGEAVGAILGHFPGFNVSPFGEWRWSMMGLAGRDPIFHAQLESEVHLWPPLQASIENLCTSCHGVMGQRQLEIDSGKTQHLSGSPSPLDSNEPLFQQDFVLKTGGSEDGDYGALARDGISCMVCHQVTETPPAQQPEGLINLFSGSFSLAEPEQGSDGIWFNQIYGQFEEVAGLAMAEAVGMTPQHSTYISSARMCGSCHTVVLPVLDKAGNALDADGKPVSGPDDEPRLIFEQTTYLEWANSQYRDEFGGVNGNTARTCQSCHMPSTFHDPATDAEIELKYRIANIQDDSYPAADEEAPTDEITVPVREDGYARHTLAGINLFGLEMFRKFPDILGVSFQDYMTSSSDGLSNAIAEGNRLARDESGSVEIAALERTPDGLRAEVTVENKAGHRFPSGVGFRRLFLEFTVRDAAGDVLWSSGSTDEFGIIVDGQGLPLPTEFFAPDASGAQQYQPHHEVITSETEVQIYEELEKSPEGVFTTNFLNRDQKIKDNRLLPKGWSPTLWPGVTPEFTSEFLEETLPEGLATSDPNFDGGTDTVTYLVSGLSDASLEGATVQVRLFYQAIPPAYLADRFDQAQQANGQRLYYIASNLDVAGTDIADWKLAIDEGHGEVPAP
jgi:hypothetical protein